MFAVARRSLVARSALIAPKRAQAAFSVSAIKREGSGVPQIYGEGGKTGAVPTDMEQATGLERFELLEKMAGREAFSMSPLEVNHMGTVSNPIKVFSLDVRRIVGCTGYPVDSHDTLYTNLHKDKDWRCPECGCAYSLDFQGDEHALGHH